MIYRGTKLSCSRLFGSTVFTPPPPSKLSLFLSLPVYRRSSLLAGEGGEGGRGAQSYGRQESLGLYKWFNPLWSF
jgi:hypothetical protein